MKTVLRWLAAVMALLVLLLAGPVWILASNQVITDGRWSNLDRSSAGLAPHPDHV
ncbi:MAG TPA: DUF3750 domain-containing protein, partial [Halomonas sp.]|nr:DUF3750 domain-containing protein [Halomonas sp.]